MTFYEEKFINGVLYFLQERVKYPTVTKIFKLLWFSDIAHIKELGVPIFHFRYETQLYGPVPIKMARTWKEGGKWSAPSEYSSFVQVKNPTGEDDLRSGNVFKALKKPNLDLFSPFEIKKMDETVFIYKDIAPGDISDLTHLKNSLWKKTLDEKGLGAEIDMTLAIEDSEGLTQDISRQLIQERDENILAFELDRV